MQVNLFAGISCLSEERRFKRKLEDCPWCKKQVTAFTVPGFYGPLKKVRFCRGCNCILFKPKRFREYASGLTPVRIYYHGCSNEDTCHDYPRDQYRIPLKVFHRCRENKDVEMWRYERIMKHDHGDEVTFEEYYECPICFDEKLLKHCEVKINLFNFNEIPGKGFSSLEELHRH